MRFEVIPVKGSTARESGLGRLEHTGWTSFSQIEQSQLQHIATINVAKFVRQHTFDDALPTLVSYVYANNISGWPSAGSFGTSYEGTITRRKHRGGLDVLISSREFRATADYHYYFERKDDHLMRHRLCSITIKPNSEGADMGRAIAAVRTCLSFVYEVSLKPLTKTEMHDGTLKIIEFPQDRVEPANREFTERPIDVAGQKKFSSSMIRWLYASDVNIHHVEYAISRYVAAARELPLENSFSAGCEAIESLFSTVNTTALPAKSKEAKAVRHLRRELRKLDVEASKRKIASDRLGGIFKDPPWFRIRDFLAAHRHLLVDAEAAIVAQADFFKYRNLSSHGRKIAIDGEVDRQRLLMLLVFQILLKVAVKSRAGLMLPRVVDLSPRRHSIEPHFVEILE